MTGESLCETLDAMVDYLVERVAVATRDASASGVSPYLTVDEAADYLRCPKKRIYSIKADIPHLREGKRILFRRSDLDAFLDENRYEPNGSEAW
jgi:excisionase family DNA binding protein